MRALHFPLIVVLLLTASNAVAQPSRQQLRVELRGLHLTSSTGASYDLAHSMAWTPYAGYAPLSESAFLGLAGRPDLSRRAARAHRSRIIALGLGGLAVVSGAILLGSSVDLHGSSSAGIGRAMGGGLLIAVGTGTAFWSASRLNRRTVPYRIADEVARDYNHSVRR